MPGPITRQTISEQAYLAIKAQIVAGMLTAGQRLLPSVLAAQLQVSPTPVKEALLRLERDGLVETEARRGIVVRRFRPDEVRDLYGVRTLLERDAVHAGFARGAITPALVDELKAQQGALLDALASRTVAGLNAALSHDRALHARIVALSGNRLVMDWHSQVMTQTHAVRVYTPLSYPPQLLRAEHGAIIDALAAGDEGKALQALTHHFDRSRQDLLDNLAVTETA